MIAGSSLLVGTRSSVSGNAGISASKLCQPARVPLAMILICSVGQDACARSTSAAQSAVAGADNGLDLSGFEAVFVVVADEQARRGDGDGAELVQREDGQPELVVALEHEHHAVAPRDAERGEIIGRAVGEGGDLSEREVALLLVVGKPEHRALVGTFARERVYDVVAEVEILRRQQLDAGQAAVFVDFLADEVVVDQAGVFLGRRLRVCRGRHRATARRAARPASLSGLNTTARKVQSPPPAATIPCGCAES